MEMQTNDGRNLAANEEVVQHEGRWDYGCGGYLEMLVIHTTDVITAMWNSWHFMKFSALKLRFCAACYILRDELSTGLISVQDVGKLAMRTRQLNYFRGIEEYYVEHRMVGELAVNLFILLRKIYFGEEKKEAIGKISGKLEEICELVASTRSGGGNFALDERLPDAAINCSGLRDAIEWFTQRYKA